MSKIWEMAEDMVDAISFVVEYAIFTLFIYEEAQQMINRQILSEISWGVKSAVIHDIEINFDFMMNGFAGSFNKWGILALYACNAYSSYLFASMMVREWANIWLGWGRMEYSFPRTGLF